MKRFIRIMAVAAVLVIAVLLVAGAASAQLFPPGPGPTPAPSGATAITSGPGDKKSPAISGNTIVWVDNTTRSVRVYDVASGQSMTIPGGIYASVGRRQVDVSGNYVVWIGMRTIVPVEKDWGVYLYDPAKGSVTLLTNDQAMNDRAIPIPTFPSISGNLVWWTNWNTTNKARNEICWYNIDNGHRGLLFNDFTFEQLYPTAGGDTLAWLDDGKISGRFDLCWLSLSSGTTTRLISPSNTTIKSRPPAVSSDGRWIVWHAVTNGSPALRMVDTTTGRTQQITGEGARPGGPAVDGNYVVWADFRDGNGDIYLYDILSGQERQVTSDSADQSNPDISGGRLVWMGNNDGYWNIYVADVDAGAQPTMYPTPIEVKSSAFANSTSIPVGYTCDGDDVSPPLSWSGVPEGTESLALIMDDPDASGFTHWVIYNISPAESGLAEGLPSEHDLPGGPHQGKNSFGTIGYGGPCPPRGPAHHYIFHLYALNRSPDLPEAADRAALEAEMQGCIIAEGVLVGTYGR